MNAKTGSLVVALALIATTSALAHPYFPLIPGHKTVQRYHFSIQGMNPAQAKNFPNQEVKGRMILTCVGEEEREGRRYFKRNTNYIDIPFMKEDHQTYQREENGAIIMGFDYQGKWRETVELPAELSIGQEWDYFDGERSKRKVTKQFSYTDSAGKEIPDCVEITRTVIDNPRLKEVTNRNYYCKGIGDVGSYFSMPSPLGAYITETRVER